MKRWIKWCGILGITMAAMGVAAHAGNVEYYVYFQNGRVLRVSNTYTDGPWIFLVLDAQNQFAVPEESVKHIERVPMIAGEPVATTGTNVGVQAAPSVEGRSPHSPPARNAYRGATPNAPGHAARSAATTYQQNNSKQDPERQKKLERLREERRKNAPNQGRRRGQRGGGPAGRRALPETPVSDNLPGLESPD
jgi:hypothetical protein